ncbi:MAG: efflux RND transporter periplasmic adaptor subunit, partial [Acidobacteria bacterium]|nr:efflux RND transporter periplasmic adaptor subunit [Acidobacteriota bacterium]
KGMVLARLDNAQLLRQREREQAGVAAAEAGLRQVATAVEFQKASLEADTDLRRAEVRVAEARLRDLLAGARRQEIEQARAALDEARTEEQRATADWDRSQRLYKNDDISRAQYDQFQARYQAASAMARQAGERLALVQEGPRPEEIEAARAQLDRAQAALRLSESGSLEVKRRQQEIEARRAEVERARAQVAVIDSQLDDAVVVSPIDGVVLSKAAEVGQVVAAGTAILALGDLEHPWLRAYIGETDLGRVKLGARVRVTTDSFPGKLYWGWVSFIASDAEFTPKQIQTVEERVKLVYRVKIGLPNPNHELKSNMPADAEIILEK